MSLIFWVTYGLLWLILAVVVLLVVLLYRQFGLMLMPGGRRIGFGGLDIAATVPVLPLRFGDGKDGVFDWTTADTGEKRYSATFALFATPSCPICDRISRDAATAAIGTAHPEIRFLWIDGGGREPGHVVPNPWTNAFSRHNEAHVAMEVPGTPFAYLVSAAGQVLAKGLVNSADEIETLISGTAGRQNGETARATIPAVSESHRSD